MASDQKLASECRELEKYFKTLGFLPELKAPVGFAHRVMRRIDEKQEKKSLASMLFKPFHIKLPIETAGVLVTAVLLVILYHPFERLKGPVVDERMRETTAPPEKPKATKQAPSAPMPAPALSKYGRLEKKSEIPAGVQRARVRIILVVEGL